VSNKVEKPGHETRAAPDRTRAPGFTEAEARARATAHGLEGGAIRTLEFEEEPSIRGEVLPEIQTQPDGSLVIDMLLATAKPIRRVAWVDGRMEEIDEVLSFAPGAHREERVRSGRMPLLAVHDQWNLDAVLGVCADPRIDAQAGTYRVRARISSRAELEGVRQDLKSRILTNTSLGYRVYLYRDVTPLDPAPAGAIPAQAERPPARRVRRLEAVDWESREGSLVPVGADWETSTRSTERPPGGATSVPVWTAQPEKTMDPTEAPTSPTATATPPAPPPPAEGARGTTTAPTPTTGAVQPPATPNGARAEDTGADQELLRQRSIRDKLRKAGLPLDGRLATELLDTRVSSAVATDRILDEVTRRDATQGGTATITDAEEDKTCRAIQDVLEHRSLRPILTEKERTELDGRLAGNPFIHQRLLRIGERYLELVHGTRGLERLGPLDLAHEILFRRRDQMMGTRGTPGFHVTSDFASVLANVANKGLQRQFDLTRDTYSQWTVPGTLPDFKQTKRVNLGDAPRLLRKLEGAEYKVGAVGEKGENVQLLTYGRAVNISRESIVNDDLGAFTRFPRAFGGSSKQLIADLVYSVLTANAVLSDGLALFEAATHGNLITAAGNAFTDANAVNALSNTRALARRQKGIPPGSPNNEVAFFLALDLVHLRVPENLETVAQKITASLTPQQVSGVNPFQGQFQSVMAEPRLGAVSQAAFYMMADPSALDTIEVDFLQGESGPVIESRMSWHADGVEMKCRLDVGVAPTEYRGLYRNDGAT